jgi:hypothetical protein
MAKRGVGLTVPGIFVEYRFHTVCRSIINVTKLASN